MVRKNVAEIIQHHVTFELEAIDRMYLNAQVPSRQTGGGLVYFLETQLGVRVPSTVRVAPISQRFVDAIERFVKTEGVDLITFEKGQRKDDVAQPGVVRRAGPRPGEAVIEFAARSLDTPVAVAGGVGLMLMVT